MNISIKIPGLEDVFVTKVENIDERIVLHVEMGVKIDKCPSCGNGTKNIHDYRIQKIKHLKWFERMTYLFYRKRRYACSCGKRFVEIIFKAAVHEALDKPVIVADRFHFCRYIYWSLDGVRRRVRSDWNDYDRKKCKKMRHVFHKDSEKLTEQDQWYLNRYIGMNEELRRAYELKELYSRWFKKAKENGHENIKETKLELMEFYKQVEQEGIPEFMKAIRTFRNWQYEILNSFVYDYSNGFLEGINNLTKVTKRNAFGFRNFSRARARILLLHKYKKIGSHVG